MAVNNGGWDNMGNNTEAHRIAEEKKEEDKAREADEKVPEDQKVPEPAAKNKQQSSSRERVNQTWYGAISQVFYLAIRSYQSNIEAVLISDKLNKEHSLIELTSDGFEFKKRNVGHGSHTFTIGGYELSCDRAQAERHIPVTKQIVSKYNENAPKYLVLPTLLVYNETKKTLFATDCSRDYTHVVMCKFIDNAVYDALIKLHSFRTCLTNGILEFIILYDKKAKNALFASIDMVEKKPHPFDEENRCLDWINVCYLVSQTNKVSFESCYDAAFKAYGNRMKKNDILAKEFVDYKNGVRRPRRFGEKPVIGKHLREQYARAASKPNDQPYVEEQIPNETQIEKIKRRTNRCTDAITGTAEEACIKFCTWTPAKMPNRFRIMIKFNGVLMCFNLQSVYETQFVNKYWQTFTKQQIIWIKKLYSTMHGKYVKEVMKFFGGSLERPLTILKNAEEIDTEDDDGRRVYLRTVLVNQDQPDLPAIAVNGLGFTTVRKYTQPSGKIAAAKRFFTRQADVGPQGSLHFEQNSSGNEYFSNIIGIFGNRGSSIFADEETGMQYYMERDEPKLVPFGIYAAIIEAMKTGYEREETHVARPTPHVIQQQDRPAGVQPGQNRMTEKEIIEWFLQNFADVTETHIRERAQVNGGLQAYYNKYNNKLTVS